MNDVEKQLIYDRKMERTYLPREPIDNCIRLAANELGVSEDSTYVVMFSFVLGGYKAFCSSSEINDDHGHYVEVVYSDHKDEFYVIHYEETNRRTV